MTGIHDAGLTPGVDAEVISKQTPLTLDHVLPEAATGHGIEGVRAILRQRWIFATVHAEARPRTGDEIGIAINQGNTRLRGMLKPFDQFSDY